MRHGRSTNGYIVMSDVGAQRLAPAERQRKRYGLVLYWGAAATVFRRRRAAEAAVIRTLAYRAEIYGTRPSRDLRRYSIVRLGQVWDGPSLRVVPPRRPRKARP